MAQKQLKKYKHINTHHIWAYYDNKTLKRAAKTLPSEFILKPFDDVGLDTLIQLASYKQQHLEEIKGIHIKPNFKIFWRNNIYILLIKQKIQFNKFLFFK